MDKISKGETLALLQANSLNTPVYHVFVAPFDWAKIDRMIDIFEDRISIRTWQDGNILCPFFPNQTRPEAHKALKEIFRTTGDRLGEIILSEGIDPATSVRCGRIMHTQFTEGADALIEYFDGPGTVRDLDKIERDRVNILTVRRFQTSDLLPWQLSLFSLCSKMFKQYPNCTIEWSQYDHPIGLRHLHFIFWEVLL